MITYNNIVGRFEKFVEEHHFLRTFTHGSPSGVDLEKFELYPTLHLVYTGATYDSTSKEYSFEVYILDLPPDKANKIDNQQQMVSNAEQAAEDILADMRNGDNVFDFGHLYSVTNASTTPLEETTSNSLSGILLSITIEVGYDYDSCNAPLTGVTPSGSTIPSGGGGTVSTIYYTSNLATSISVGANDVNFPAIGDTEMLTHTINLKKSLSFVQNALQDRGEIYGINSSATISSEIVFTVTGDGAGLIQLTQAVSGGFPSGLVSHNFTEAGTVILTISVDTVSQYSDYGFFAITALATTTGSVVLDSVNITINNQF